MIIHQALGLGEVGAPKTAVQQTVSPKALEELVDKRLSARLESIVERLVKVIDRRVQDFINPFTSRLEELARRYAELVERLEAVEQKLGEVEQRLRSGERPGYVPVHRQEYREERRERRRSAIEILREQGAIFESEIARRIKDRNTFFAKLEREGAKILDLQGERIAVDPVFWSSFLEKLSRLATNNDEEIKRVLGPLEYRLFTRLRESALIYYDATQRRWNFVEAE